MLQEQVVHAAVHHNTSASQVDRQISPKAKPVEILAGPDQISHFHQVKNKDEAGDDDVVNFYLEEAGRRPLLTGPQELELGYMIQKGLKAQRSIKDKSSFTQTLVNNLKEQIEQGQQAEVVMTESNLRLVVKIAKIFHGAMPFLDLIQEGNIGLMTAVGKFDPRRKLRFSTYATRWIFQSIQRSLHDQAEGIHIPVRVYEDIYKLRKLEGEQFQEEGVIFTDESLRKKMKISQSRLQTARQISQLLPISLSTALQGGNGEEDLTLEDVLVSREETPEEQCIQSRLRESLDDKLDTLDPIEARILRMRYGLYDGYSYSKAEVGRLLNIPADKIGAIEDNALRRMRHPIRSRSLRSFLYE